MDKLKAFVAMLESNRAAFVMLMSTPFSVIFTLTAIPYYNNTHWDMQALLALVIQTLGVVTLSVSLFLMLELVYLYVFDRKSCMAEITAFKSLFGK